MTDSNYKLYKRPGWPPCVVRVLIEKNDSVFGDVVHVYLEFPKTVARLVDTFVSYPQYLSELEEL